jgi:succinyl-CoA synthetase beta subunit
MNIHEYQAKTVLKGFGVSVPRGFPAFTVDEAVKAAEELGGPVWVVKAQIHAGGRGKGGGVKVVRSIDDVRKEATRMLGMTLVTHQTGPHGRVVRRLYIEEGSSIERELYLSALVDRETSRIAFIASTEGGMDIEQVAKATPEKILTLCRSQHRHRAEAQRRSGEAMRQADRRPLQCVRRQRHEPARDQSARGDARRPGDLPRCQDQLRR